MNRDEFYFDVVFYPDNADKDANVGVEFRVWCII